MSSPQAWYKRLEQIGLDIRCHLDQSQQQMGVSENVVYPIVPNGFADHYPY